MANYRDNFEPMSIRQAERAARAWYLERLSQRSIERVLHALRDAGSPAFQIVCDAYRWPQLERAATLNARAGKPTPETWRRLRADRETRGLPV